MNACVSMTGILLIARHTAVACANVWISSGVRIPVGATKAEDSLSMIAESIYARKPVLSCAPKHVVTNANDHAALMRYEQAHLIQRMRLDESLDRCVDLFSHFAGTNHLEDFPDVPAKIRAALLPFLK